MPNDKQQQPVQSATAATLSYLELADVLVEFLEVAIHYVLYVRELYPAELFEARRKYNVPVQMSRHPALNTYIRNVLSSLKPDLEKGIVSKLYLAIHDPSKTLVEKFTFHIRSLLEGFDEAVRKTAQTTINLNDIEANLRAFLMKIGVCDSMLRPNPPDCSFVLLVELTNPTHPSAPPPNIPSSAWVPGEPAEVDLDANASIVPLKTMDAGLLKMQLYAEESARKGKS